MAPTCLNQPCPKLNIYDLGVKTCKIFLIIGDSVGGPNHASRIPGQ